MKKYFEDDLFILDLANNHFGDVKHAITVVKAMAKVTKANGVNAAIKLQLRNLDTFVHASMRDSDHRYVRRFLDTSLSIDDFKRITDVIRNEGLTVMATPFDESSIDNFEALGIEILKIASASANDIPLLAAAADTKYPIVASSGGLTQFEVDDLYSKLLESGNEFALMHCVSIYPSPSETLQMLQIKNFRNRYVGTPIGWSTHEDPDDPFPIVIAKTLGASLFERHVGVNSEKYQLNNYSSTPEQLERWIAAYLRSAEMLGSEVRLPSTEAEVDSLKSLRRGYFITRDMDEGSDLSGSYESAFPVVDADQLTTADQIPSATILSSSVKAGTPLLGGEIKFTDAAGDSRRLKKIVFEVRATLARAGVHLNREAAIELSHHYGIDRFREFGATLITVLNRDYAKKLVVMLPRQKHPTHRHMKKEETFQLLWGDLDLTINGKKHAMQPGQVLTVERGSWHKFQSNYGAVVEEVLSAIGRKHELEILIDSRISEEVLLPSRLARLIEKTVFNYQEPAWLLNLFHLIWIDARRTNVSFKTKYIREFIGDVKIWQPTLSLRSRILHALGRIWEVSFRFLKPKFLLTFFSPTRKLGIRFLANRLSKFDISQLPDFSRHSLVIFPSIGYEPGSWLLFERIRAQGSQSLVAIDNWDNVSSKSIYIRKPSFISVPGPKSAETARELHGFSKEQILEWGMPKFDILRSQLKSSDSLRRLLYVGYSQPHDEHRSLETILKVTYEKDVEVSYRPHPLRKHTRFTEASRLDSKIQIRGKSGSEMRSTGGHPPLDSSYAADLEWADLVVGPPTTLLLEALFVGKPIVVDATLDSHHRSSGFYALHGYKHMQELLTVHGIRIAEDYIQLEKHVSDATNSLADFPRGQESVRDILAQDKSYLSSFLSFVGNLNQP